MSARLATLLATGGVAVLLFAASAPAQDQSVTLHVELGALWQEKNRVQIPNDAEGTRFSLAAVTGSGPWPSLRLEGIWRIDARHSMRFLYAPLSLREKGRLQRQTRFAGRTYNSQDAVKAHYTFNSWRVGYRYHLVAQPAWDLRVGATLKVRDAKVKLIQGGVSSSDDNLGVVPLLYLAGEYRFDDRWSVAADFDGLAGGPGRAIDLGLRLQYQVDDDWRVGLGYRTLEGGADTDDVYSFAWFNAVVVTADYRF